MKKLASVIIVGLLPFFGLAGNAQLFQVDTSAIYSEFEQITPETVTPHNTTGNIASWQPVTNPGPMGIPSFLWGCFFGPMGLIAVDAVTDSTDESNKALKGCVINGAGILAMNILYLITTL